MTLGPEGGLGSVADSDSVEDTGEVCLDGLLADFETLGNLLVSCEVGRWLVGER